MTQFPYSEEILEFIVQHSTTDAKLRMQDFKGYGKRGVDEQAFHRRIDAEGVIQLQRNYDEL